MTTSLNWMPPVIKKLSRLFSSKKCPAHTRGIGKGTKFPDFVCRDGGDDSCNIENRCGSGPQELGGYEGLQNFPFGTTGA
mmetsp:Transcript_28925/g.29359  ORF Transcript_28925/g.29359 Transcript_28925/m.29359 type:complete len:80 (-) Transcript_28925:342-581(-)